jgi:flagellar biosynthesis/type III secretory pathway ATPase
MLAFYREAEDLVAVGAYRHGAVPRLDDALARMPKVEKFLRQRTDEPCAAKTTLAALTALYKEAP